MLTDTVLDFLRNTFLNRNRYRTHSEAVIVSCFFNPQNSPYRLLAFQKWYKSVKHLNHRIVECLIGPEAKSQLPPSPYITQVRTDSLLWHKETLLNKVIAELPRKFKYVFWVDADVLFTNKDWLVEGVRRMEAGANVVQPFSYCVHLDKNQIEPSFDVDGYRAYVNDPAKRHPALWRSFCAAHQVGLSGHENYDVHGHVGFAWGARREVLTTCPLYDRGLIGGADHIIAHAAAGQVPHKCITKSFTDNLAEVEAWMRRFSFAVKGRIDYVPGDLYHIWHGDIKNRKYLKRIKDFTPATKEIVERDANGLHVARGKNEYMTKYYREREVAPVHEDFGGFDAGFAEEMGYSIADIVDLFGQPYYAESDTGTATERVGDGYVPPVSEPSSYRPDPGAMPVLRDVLEDNAARPGEWPSSL